ncbi:FecR domain-containing protein [Paraglaciecola sp. L3A3]|uniref:FecR family protein n=1 Tax=Paraglaciecola sp. L3A3 TaxID=2686358 RepID=UPI00131E7024|nr:FecR domain-containing protein [Paraglaciecola sp. L3A3]
MNHNIIKFAAPRSVEDIAADWLIKMDGDVTLTKVEQTEFAQWIESDPQNKREFLSLAQVWDDVPVEKIHQLLNAKHYTAKQKQSFLQGFAFRPAFALCSMFFVAIILFVFSGKQTTEYTTNGLYVTNIGQQNKHQLVDGSVIYLNTNSRVQVDYTEDNRNVWLVYGEAHFEVAKDANKPFRVYAAGGRVQAVGTAFNVRLRDNLLDVLVTEGRIALSAVTEDFITTPFSQERNEQDANHMNTILSTVGMLDAGQKVTLNAMYEGKAALKNVAKNIQNLDSKELERQQAWQTGVLIFDGQTMSDFVNEVSRFTHATFIINDPQVANMKVGGRYKINKLDQVLVALEETFNIEVSQISNNSYLLRKKQQ